MQVGRKGQAAVSKETGVSGRRPSNAIIKRRGRELKTGQQLVWLWRPSSFP